jgi:hypothetical protein
LLLGSWLQHEWQALETAQNDVVQRQQQVQKRILQARHEDLIKAQQKTEQASNKLLTQLETSQNSGVVNTKINYNNYVMNAKLFGTKTG